MKKTKYDLAFGFGIACSCSETLRRAGLQLLSFPGDWTSPVWGRDFPAPNLVMRVDWLCRGFDDGFFDPNDFMFSRRIETTHKDAYVNRKTRYVFNHDFPAGCDFAAELPKVAAKYGKRRDRLVTLIRAARRVLVLRLDYPNGQDPTSLDDCRYAHDRLRQTFPGVDFDFILVQPDPGHKLADRLTERPEPWLTRLAFDYTDPKSGNNPLYPDLTLTAAAVGAFATVRDYRTPDEKRLHALNRRRKRWASLGATSAFGYQLRRLSLWFHGRRNVLLDLVARLRRTRFDQIAILGFNCEPAFRFYRKWGFLDSSLFAWANVRSLANLTAAVRGLDRLGTGTFTYSAESRMWRCDNAQVYFHGRLQALPDAPQPPEAQLAADREELRSRLAHLKEKFRSYAANGNSVLFVHKLKEKDAEDPRLGEMLDALEAALAGLDARNWKLLVICERKLLNRMPPGPNRLFRAVNAYNPNADVTNPKKGDPAGWNRIFSEFAPRRILPKSHGFKFESV